MTQWRRRHIIRTKQWFFRDATLPHESRVGCFLPSNAYFACWQSYLAKSEPHRWRWFFDENVHDFWIVLEHNSRIGVASNGQKALVLASAWSYTGSGQDLCKIRYNDVTERPNCWERHLQMTREQYKYGVVRDPYQKKVEALLMKNTLLNLKYKIKYFIFYFIFI